MTSALQYPFPHPPQPATREEVAPGIFWLRMPLPFALDHINLWLLDDGEGWAQVDTGMGNDETKALWQRVRAEALDGRPVRRLIATHFHPDHMGLSGWLCEQWGVTLTATLGEWLFGRMLSVEPEADFVATQVEFYRRTGVDAETLGAVEARGHVYRSRIHSIPRVLQRIADGDELEIGGRRWRVMIGQGHAAEHACLYCAELNVLISGDQILPRITPIVGVWPQEPDADPLGLFLKSLAQFRDLPEDVLVLPSHGLPFRGLHARLDAIDVHHDERLARTLEACARPATGAELMRALFTRKLDLHQTVFAVGEGIAHAHYLIGRGELLRETGDDGVWRYRRR